MDKDKGKLSTEKDTEDMKDVIQKVAKKESRGKSILEWIVCTRFFTGKKYRQILITQDRFKKKYTALLFLIVIQ